MAGLVDRDHVSGVYLWHQLTATFATQSLIILVQIGIVLEILHGFYGMVINGSWVTVVALMYATAFTGMSIGKNNLKLLLRVIVCHLHKFHYEIFRLYGLYEIYVTR